MNQKVITQQVVAILMIVSLLLSACNLDSSQLAGTAAATDQVTAALAALQAQSEGPLDIDYYTPTGAARWVAAEGGVLTRQFARQNLTADAVAMTFLSTYGTIFGVSDAANVLQLTETATDDSGAQHVGFRQQQNGVPVFGTKLLVHLDNEGAVAVVNGYTVPAADSVDTTPTLDAATAGQSAMAHVAITDSVSPPAIWKSSTLA